MKNSELESIKKDIEALKKRPMPKKPKNNYRIIRVENDDGSPSRYGAKKITMTTFQAANDKEAYEYLKKYRRLANKAYVYYFDDNEKDIFEQMRENDEKKKGFSKLWDELTFWVELKVIDRVKNIRWWIADVIFWLKTGHNRNESWNLDSHVLKDMIFNIKRLKQYKHGIAQEFVDQAVIESHKDEKDFDLQKYYAKHGYGHMTDEEWKLAEKLVNAEFDRGLENIYLYMYYSDYGIFDEKEFPEMKEIDEKYRKTLPYIPGRFRAVDYKKIHAMSEKQWNKIWDWSRKWLRMCWD